MTSLEKNTWRWVQLHPRRFSGVFGASAAGGTRDGHQLPWAIAIHSLWNLQVLVGEILKNLLIILNYSIDYLVNSQLAVYYLVNSQLFYTILLMLYSIPFCWCYISIIPWSLYSILLIETQGIGWAEHSAVVEDGDPLIDIHELQYSYWTGTGMFVAQKEWSIHGVSWSYWGLTINNDHLRDRWGFLFGNRHDLPPVVYPEMDNPSFCRRWVHYIKVVFFAGMSISAGA